jgi:hypothetical protein
MTYLTNCTDLEYSSYRFSYAIATILEDLSILMSQAGTTAEVLTPLSNPFSAAASIPQRL